MKAALGLSLGLSLCTGCVDSMIEDSLTSADDGSSSGIKEPMYEKDFFGSIVVNVICPPGDSNCTGIGGTGEEGILPPDVAYGRGVYVVVTQAYQKGIVMTLAARLNASGTLLDPEGIVLHTTSLAGTGYESQGAAVMGTPHIAFDGSVFMVVWQDVTHGSMDILGNILTAEGEVVYTEPMAINTMPGEQRAPEIAFGGNTFFVAYTQEGERSSDILGTLVSSSGDISHSEGQSILAGAGDETMAAIAYGQEAFLVAAENTDEGGVTHINAALVDGKMNATALGTVGTGPTAALQPAVASNGSQYLVGMEVYAESNANIQGVLLDNAGSILSDFAVAKGSDSERRLDVNFDGSAYFTVYTQVYSSGENTLVARYVEENGEVGGAGTLTSSIDANSAPSIAFDGTNHLVAYRTQTSTGVGIQAIFVTH